MGCYVTAEQRRKFNKEYDYEMKAIKTKFA
jgi:hypothetical protein